VKIVVSLQLTFTMTNYLNESFYRFIAFSSPIFKLTYKAFEEELFTLRPFYFHKAALK